MRNIARNLKWAVVLLLLLPPLAAAAADEVGQLRKEV